MISRRLAGTTASVFCAAMPYLGGCGGSVHHDAPFEAVVMTGSEDDLVSTVYACFPDREPLKLGATGVAYALSPKSLYLALDTGNGSVDLVSTSDASVRQLGGGATVQGMRWSNDEKQLAYFAGGVPAIADGDGSHSRRIDVSLADSTDSYNFQDAEWSPDGSRVAFVTRGKALLVDAHTGSARVFSEKAIAGYGTPWSLAFTPDGSVVALLQLEEPDNRTILLVRTDTLESREIAGIHHYAFLGWSTDGNWVSVADTGFRLWLVPRNDGGAVEVGGVGFPSPVAPEIGFVGGASLHVRSLDGMNDQVLATPAGGFARWATNGSALAYEMQDAAGQNNTVVVSRSEGNVLVPPSTWILFGPDDWVVRAEGAQTSVTQRLGMGPAGAFHSEYGSEYGPPSEDHFQWLSGERIAFVSDRLLHVAKVDGTGDHVSCSDVRGIAVPQGSRF